MSEYKKCLDCERFDFEYKVLNESVYNWKKHFIVQIPDYLDFALKMFLYYFIFQVVIHILVSELFDKLPSYCASL